MPDPRPHLFRHLARTTWSVLLASGLLAASGCGSLSSLTRKESIEEQLDKDPRYSIAGVQGPQERKISQANWERKREDLLRSGDEEAQKVLAQLESAQKLYDAGKFAEAEKAFHTIVKERRAKYESFAAKVRKAWVPDAKDPHSLYDQFGDPIEEDALFMKAECQFAQRHFADAEETYQELVEKYPSTRYLDPTMRQLFRIARYWLDFPEDVGESGDAEVRVASNEETSGGQSSQKPSALSRVPVFPNITDKSRPLFDTYGRGKLALRSIWLHDATGPLADDALMMAANHALRTEDYVEAARLYALLREQYPDSPHLKDAYLLGSHVTLASYQGPAYDGKSLETSRQLKEELLATFPNLSPDEREQLEHEIRLLEDAEIARLYDLVDFYMIKRMYPAVKLHCYQIINEYPDSKYAEMARARLREVAAKEESWNNSIWNFNKRRQPAPPVAQSQPENPPKESSPSGITLPAEEPQQSDSDSVNPPQKPSFFQRWNPLRKAEQPPKLQPIEESDDQKQEFPELAETPGRVSL